MKLMVTIVAFFVSFLLYLGIFLGIAWILDTVTSINIYYLMVAKVAFIVWTIHCLFNISMFLIKKKVLK